MMVNLSISTLNYHDAHDWAKQDAIQGNLFAVKGHMLNFLQEDNRLT